MSKGNRILAGGLPILLMLLINMILVTSSALADEITIVADEWPPYNGEPDSTEPGYGIEIAKQVFEEAGHTVKYSIVPWRRAILMAREGRYNAIIGAIKEEAPDFIFPEEEFGISSDVFFVKNDSSWKYDGSESLLAVKIGLIKDYSYGDKFDAFFKANKGITDFAHGEDPLSSNINKLLLGRVDVIVENPNVLAQKAMQMGIADKIIKAGVLNLNDKLYIAFSPKIKKSGAYADLLTKGIRKLKASGRLDAILSKYGLTYWK